MGMATRTDRPTRSPPWFARRERERTSHAPERIPHGGDEQANGTASCPQAQVVGVAAGAAADGEHDIPLEDVAGARLLVSDVRVAVLLLDEARHRVVERLLGVSEEDVLYDYELTNRDLLPAMKPLFEHFRAAGGNPHLLEPVLGVDPDYLRTALDEMNQRFGSVEGYFEEGLGIDTDAHHRLRDTLVGS